MWSYTPLWRNWLARSAVNRKVGGSIPPRGVRLVSFTCNITKKSYKFINSIKKERLKIMINCLGFARDSVESSYSADVFKLCSQISDSIINSLAIFHISSNKYISFSFSTISYYSPHYLFCLSNSFFPPFSLLPWFLWFFFVSLLVHRFLSFISFNSSFHSIAPLIYLNIFVSFLACRILPP